MGYTCGGNAIIQSKELKLFGDRFLIGEHSVIREELSNDAVGRRSLVYPIKARGCLETV